MSTAIHYASSLSSVFQPEQMNGSSLRTWRPANQSWMEDPTCSLGSTVLPILPSSDSGMDWSTFALRDKSFSNLFSEPTSVLDLTTSPGTSPGRSSYGSASPDARSQQSYSSSESTPPTFSQTQSFILDEYQSPDKSFLSRGAIQTNVRSDIPSCWVDCLPEPEGLNLPAFDDCDTAQLSRRTCKEERMSEGSQGLQSYSGDINFDLVDMSLDSNSFMMLSEPELLADPISLMDGPDKLDQVLTDPLTEFLRTGSLVGGSAQPAKYENDLQFADHPIRSANCGLGQFSSSEFVSLRSSRLGFPAALPPKQCGEPATMGSSNIEEKATWTVPDISPPQVENGLHLVHLLLGCAEAIEESNYDLAKSFLTKLDDMSSPFGDAMERIAVYFGDAINERIAKDFTETECYTDTVETSSHKRMHDGLKFTAIDTRVAYQAFYQLLPYVKFAHFTANQAILESVGNASLIHVVDLDIQQGLQWPAFIQSLAVKQGGSPFLKITGVGADLTMLQHTGRRLCEFAASVHVPLEYHAVHERLENLHPGMLQLQAGESLAVNCGNVLNRLVENPGCLNSVLRMVRRMKPTIVTLLEAEANHNVISFMSRFVEALHHYSALFDCLEATLDRNSSERLRIESVYFASDIRNILACEGSDRTTRHLRTESWQMYFRQAGFQGMALSEYAVYQAKLLTGLYSGGTYKLAEEGSALNLGWQDTPIVSVSAWTC